MLKALELFGFKSFADKTRLEFPNGISVVVGPNGSGKSNVVDAVKWVLGSQSAKSLRGKEMIDVIFNGCASRGAAGTAEVTLTLDNSEGRLAIDAKEVHVGRRVYRSGEGEYLLNRQPCRLRDIRELLATTGITTEAYCIIEQGKVDALLQSSPRDRRVIFEEAAGISQFKIKKANAARRMERVEQNLLRLSDIVDEVESRLRSVRLQAGKARRYRECTERLKHLRMEAALVDWRMLTEQLIARESTAVELRQRIEVSSGQLQADEMAGHELEKRLEASAQELREFELQASTTREQIAVRQATIENQQARRTELKRELTRLREQLETMSVGGGADQQYRGTAEQLAAADAELCGAKQELIDQTAREEASQRELDVAVAGQESIRAALAEHMRALALLGDQILALDSQLPVANGSLERLQARLTELAPMRDQLAAELKPLEEAEVAITADAERHRESLAVSERRLAEVRRELARADAHQRRTETQLTRVRERITVLTELENRLEGLGTGVQDVLRLIRESGAIAGEVRGLVADLFHVDVDTASLIEVALGERAQFLVAATAGPLLSWLEQNPLRVADRVGFLTLDSRAALTALDHVNLTDEPGVMGRADRFVESEAEYQPLVRRMLGRTWLVDQLATALRLSNTNGRGLEFVTSDGEFLMADGTLIVGPRHAAAGMLSRRSELRACGEQARDLEQQLAVHGANHARWNTERARQESLVGSSVSAYTAAAGKLAEARRETASFAGRLDRANHEYSVLDEEHRSLIERIGGIRVQIEAFRLDESNRQAVIEELESQLEASEQLVADLRERQIHEDGAATQRKIFVARCEQRVEMLREQMEAAQRSQHEREQLVLQARQQLADRESQILEAELSISVSTQALAELMASKQQHVDLFAQYSAASEAVRTERSALVERIRAAREQLGALQNQQHKVEVAATQLRHERQTLCERMQEDYGVELDDVARSEQREESSSSNRPAVDKEIATLREQLSKIGPINLEALDELEQIETRFEKLSSQYRDLVEAKESLERIVQRINLDSRQLFLTTLETIRGHFQELFRRLFGGGEADVVVNEAEDVLESGIEIIAKPPGKEACSINLLSGGEKTLTCVALLLAVFRSKPSPFCILDEVDAALDEANIGRFVAVLKEFLSFTQFIVITHSKKTMSGADTIYGITMEESGVSKRVSVRFEDVSEDGHVSPAALFAGTNAEAADASASAPARRAA